MGQKINPIGLRLQVNRTWDSRWFADGADYGKLLHEDLAIREFIKKNAAQAGISRVIIERPHTQVPGDDPRRPSRRHHRQEGRRHRGAAQEAGAVHQVGAAPQHRRGAQARDRRRAGRREHRPAARAPGVVPPRDEAGGAERDAHGRARHPDQRRRAASAAPRSPGPSGTARAGCRCTRCAPTSTTRSARPRPPTGSSGSRSGSSRARSWSTIPQARDRRQPELQEGGAGVASAAIARRAR